MLPMNLQRLFTIKKIPLHAEAFSILNEKLLSTENQLLNVGFISHQHFAEVGT